MHSGHSLSASVFAPSPALEGGCREAEHTGSLGNARTLQGGPLTVPLDFRFLEDDWGYHPQASPPDSDRESLSSHEH